MNIQILGWVAGGIVAIGGGALAGAWAGDQGSRADLMSVETFQERRAVIEENFGDGGAYMEISRSDRRAVVTSLDLMEALLARHGGIEAMNPEARIHLFNEQETINELLTTAARDSRLRCQRSTRVGTHFKTTVCETYAQRRQRMEDQRALYDGQRPYQTPTGPLDEPGGWSGGPYQGGLPRRTD